MPHNHKGVSANSELIDKTSLNLPQGEIPSGKSARPDGYFCDAITPTDLLDLRRHTSAVGHDLKSEFDKKLVDVEHFIYMLSIKERFNLGSLEVD